MSLNNTSSSAPSSAICLTEVSGRLHGGYSGVIAIGVSLALDDIHKCPWPLTTGFWMLISSPQ